MDFRKVAIELAVVVGHSWGRSDSGQAGLESVGQERRRNGPLLQMQNYRRKAHLTWSVWLNVQLTKDKLCDARLSEYRDKYGGLRRWEGKGLRDLKKMLLCCACVEREAG
jgi:hypothetical protein